MKISQLQLLRPKGPRFKSGGRDFIGRIFPSYSCIFINETLLLNSMPKEGPRYDGYYMTDRVKLETLHSIPFKDLPSCITPSYVQTNRSVIFEVDFMHALNSGDIFAYTGYSSMHINTQADQILWYHFNPAHRVEKYSKIKGGKPVNSYGLGTIAHNQVLEGLVEILGDRVWDYHVLHDDISKLRKKHLRKMGLKAGNQWRVWTKIFGTSEPFPVYYEQSKARFNELWPDFSGYNPQFSELECNIFAGIENSLNLNTLNPAK